MLHDIEMSLRSQCQECRLFDLTSANTESIHNLINVEIELLQKRIPNQASSLVRQTCVSSKLISPVTIQFKQ